MQLTWRYGPPTIQLCRSRKISISTLKTSHSPKASTDEGCNGNAVDADEIAETAELDGKLELGKELVDAVMPDELAAGGGGGGTAAVVSADCIAEEARPPNKGTDGVDATEAESWVEKKVDEAKGWVENKVDEAEVGETVADAITLEVATVEDANGADEEEEPKLNGKAFAAPVLEKRGAEEAAELVVEAMLPKPKEG